MLLLVLGGSSSGKSRLAEEYCQNLGNKRLYIATMRPVDDESRARILRHQRQRAGYGYSTAECYGGLDELCLDSRCDAALLECVGNLIANEMFALSTPHEWLVDKVMHGVDCVLEQVKSLVIVSNLVFGDSRMYDNETQAYISALGRLNTRLAAKSDAVVEAVCGLPLILKGKECLP